MSGDWFDMEEVTEKLKSPDKLPKLPKLPGGYSEFKYKWSNQVGIGFKYDGHYLAGIRSGVLDIHPDGLLDDHIPAFKIWLQRNT